MNEESLSPTVEGADMPSTSLNPQIVNVQVISDVVKGGTGGLIPDGGGFQFNP